MMHMQPDSGRIEYPNVPDRATLARKKFRVSIFGDAEASAEKPTGELVAYVHPSGCTSMHGAGENGCTPEGRH